MRQRIGIVMTTQVRDQVEDHKSGAPGELGRGSSVGRYLVVGLVGRGGMGEVYAAYDPELNRKVALKLIRAQTGPGIDPTEGRARLLREAQAIARLSDPNVVVIFDVGTFEDRVFLTMEFVDGSTLAYWLHAKPRTWREVVTTFSAAGRGIASAHRAGVVHRDFKPENVMITRDGQVRVMDFGLARTIGPATKAILGAPTAAIATNSVATRAISVSLTADPDIGAWVHGNDTTRDLSREAASFRTDVPISPSPLDSRLTVTGALMGTPGYMAPEQFRGGTIDARTDQFSFCVALYEGLYGERPFAGQNITDLTANVLAGQVRAGPPNARVPGWLRKIVLRGLRPDREERHPSMERLLALLARDPAKTLRRRLTAGATIGITAVLAVGLVRSERRQRMECLGAAAKLAEIWELPGGRMPSPRKEAIRRAFMATGKPYAADAFRVVMGTLDRYVTTWNGMHREACEATNLRGEQSAEVLDLRMSCLGERLSEVRALTTVFGNPGGDVVGKSVEVAQALKPVEQCADIATLRAVVRPPEDPIVRRAVADVRAKLAGVKAQVTAGRLKGATGDIARVVEDAQRTNYLPVIAEALLQLGEIQLFSGAPPMAEKSYEEAIWLAEGARYDEAVLEGANQLIATIGFSQRRHQDGERWASFAGAVLRRLGSGYDMLAAGRANNLAMVYYDEGRLEDALMMFREAVNTKTKALGEGHFDVALSLVNQALVLHELGRTDEAIERNQRALEIFNKTLGPDHPRVANSWASGAEFMNARGRYGEAQTMGERALAILERESDPDPNRLAAPLTAIGISWLERDQPEQAIPPLERALRIGETGEVETARMGSTRFALARALREANRSRNRWMPLAEKARADFEKSPHTAVQKAAVDSWINLQRGHRDHISVGKKTVEVRPPADRGARAAI